MAITSFLKKLFGGPSEETAVKDPVKKNFSRKTQDTGKTVSLQNLEDFVKYVVCALVDYPEEVSITTKNENNENVIWISCRKEDTGKIIGKKGKTIIALRALIAGAAGRMQNRVKVEVAD